MGIWSVCSGVAAAAAVGLWVRDHRRLSRLHPNAAKAIPSWLSGKPGALKLRTRAYAGALAALLVWVASGASLPMVGVGLGAGGAVVVALGFLDAAGERKRTQQLAFDLPTSLELLAAALAAGSPITAATREVAASAPEEVAQELRLILARIDVGSSEAEAWRASQDRPVIGSCARDVARATRSGSALVACLRRHAQEGRRARRAGLEKRAKSVGVKSVVPMSVCFLPAFVLVGVVPVVAGLALTLFR